ncbi:transcriptional regulator [Anaerotruncus sp. AF02-27]|nr:transcriptional regulator [Anaerotruncus sp. AF02-27]
MHCAADFGIMEAKKEAIHMYEQVQIPLEILKGKYSAMILLYLCHEGTQRFGEIRTAVGSVSNKVLSKQLRDLEYQGMLVRIAGRHPNLCCSYSVTERALSLLPALEALHSWGCGQRI